ncbi:MAG: hypothetical protein EPO06_05490 [Burkholderiaceae bacterium]|nr:MAG: hypothetical protein EPO06_05490 [Burkholderiaceae bacterium]
MTAFVLNSLRYLSQAAQPQSAISVWLLRPLALTLSFIVACVIWCSQYLVLSCTPGLSSRSWIKRRLRLLNRMHPLRAAGFIITLIGLLMVGLSIAFKIILEPVPYVEVPQSLESKDDALRIILESQAQNPALDRPLLSVQDLLRKYTHKWDSTYKHGRVRLLDNSLRDPAKSRSGTANLRTEPGQPDTPLSQTPAVGLPNLKVIPAQDDQRAQAALERLASAPAYTVYRLDTTPLKMPRHLLENAAQPCASSSAIARTALQCLNIISYATAPVSNH